MFTATLLDWFALHKRDLPWRHTKDPYAIWLSEVILQQTRIQQGMDYWWRFMHRWPKVENLANATEDEVLKEWQGLGYYSRARNLHTAAHQVMTHGGFPTTIQGLRALKGVGDYTAAAIGSIAFGLPVAVVDGNVYRVLARHYGIDTPINTTFGAIQCTPTSPKCLECPLQETCEALHMGRIDDLPVKEKKLTIQTRLLTYIYIRCKGKTAIRRRPAGDIWQGLWEPYLEEARGKEPETRGMLERATIIGKNVKHVLTHRVLMADFYLLETDTPPVLPDEYIWVEESELGNYAVPRLIEKLLEKLNKS